MRRVECYRLTDETVSICAMVADQSEQTMCDLCNA